MLASLNVADLVTTSMAPTNMHITWKRMQHHQGQSTLEAVMQLHRAWGTGGCIYTSFCILGNAELSARAAPKGHLLRKCRHKGLDSGLYSANVKTSLKL